MNTAPLLRTSTLVAGSFALVMWAPLAGQASDRCDERRTVTRELSADGIGLLEIEARAGSLEVTGSPRSNEILVTATLCAEREGDLALFDARLERSGSTAELEAIFPDRDRSQSNRQMRVDLVVTVPEGLATNVHDGSGHMEIEGVGGLEIHDGSGHVTIRDIDGGVTIDDGSGSVEIEDVSGSVRLEDGSGNAVISGVGGSVELSDGSGLVEISEVTGNVHVTDKGSGQIRVDDVRGDLRVEGTRRDRIRYSNVGGSIDLPRARRRR